ncbi:long-chain fatty acid--CoA ligase [Chitinophaga sp. XS-30]|uniref:AMP-dependent synthetase/ligase n=1 Tax=Chitinophaga sp. XS-30 TaxID=2604421 RepID=UPI0011DDCDDB|nr:long-chain fatty acid--CoA ligase [Chitinophaga sp. XS-30]QEH42719.1 long-chain fatty acid--CoA ligase [Chitinophaga sp. XS-30]
MNVQPKRLFDAVNYQLQQFPKPDMLVSKVDGNWKPYSTQEVQRIVNRLSAGLLSLGVSGNDFSPEGADKIGIISNNRPEWVFADLAVQQTGAVLVPLYPTTNPLEIKFILNNAAVKYMFVSSVEMLEKIRELQKDIPSLQHIYTFDEIPGADHWSKVTALATDELLQQVETIKAGISDEHLATIIYTSGTTGTPKGVMLTHRNIVSNVFFSKNSFPFPDAPDQKVLSFLPLNHIFEKMCTYIYLFSGISTYYAESLDKIADNLREVRPDGFTTVPRLLEKVYEKIMSKGNELKGVKRGLFFWAVALGKKYDNNISGGFWYNLQLALANKLIFSKWREALGGNISFIVTGGAACQENLLRIFSSAKIPVYEGYGPTENSPVISVNRRYPPGNTMFGTTGPLIEGVELKFTEDGEICVKGPSMMKGYYKRPDLTAETIIDGWLHTGDIGQLINGKFLKITDRKKELFKTSGGKYVAPQPIENKCKESPFIEQLMVIGSERKFVSALIVPSFNMLRRWMGQQNIPFTTNEEAIKKPEVIAMYEKVVERYNSSFNHVEQIKKFALLPQEWGVETGEMTPKLSLRRKVIMDKYKNEIEQIYAGASAAN